MDGTQPWMEYAKETLSNGYAYPLGRDAVELALTQSSVRVRSLLFSGPGVGDSPGSLVIDVWWAGTGHSGHLKPKNHDPASNLVMRFRAVPSQERAAIRDALTDGALSRELNGMEGRRSKCMESFLAFPHTIGPHYDYRDPTKMLWRVFRDDRVEPK